MKLFYDKLNIRFLNEKENQIELSLATLVLSLLLICYIISGPLLRKFHIKMIKPSGLIMILGIIITLITKVINPESNFFKGFQFNHSLFFTFILPIIIFCSSYNSKIESTLKYLRYILLFSISGTFFSFILIGSINYCLNAQKFFTVNVPFKEGHLGKKTYYIDFSILEIFQFSASICATDSVISLAFLMEDNEPKLNAISLGESILNNAVAISLFNYVSELEEGKIFKFFLPFEILFFGFLIFILSIIIGMSIGIFHAFFLRFMKKFKINRVQEITTILLFGFISFTICDCFKLSSMTSLMACGLCMSHYTFYNLKYQTREESALINYSLNLLAEGLVYSSLGMIIVYYTLHMMSVRFIIIQLLLVIICRIFTIYGQIKILEICGVKPKYFKLKNLHKFALTNIGIIRGVVSYGLSLLITTPNQNHKNLLIGTTIYIIFLTNIICIFISPLSKIREKEFYSHELLENDLSNDRLMKYDIFTFIHPNTETGIIKPKKIKRSQALDEENNSIIYKFIEYDKKNCLPKIIENWPEVQEDNNNISRKIKKVLGKWAEDKEKNNTYKSNYTIGIDLPGFNNVENINNNQIKEKEVNKLFIDNDNKIGSNENSGKNIYNSSKNKEKKTIELLDI
jgi:NhaP-type Na+/H+ or K+/H+ antiporter